MPEGQEAEVFGPPAQRASASGWRRASAVERLGEGADAQAAAELFEGVLVLRPGAVQVLSFGDQLHGVVARDAGLAQDALEGAQVAGVDDQQLVLVELDLHGPVVGNDRYAGAAVVEQQVLEVVIVA